MSKQLESENLKLAKLAILRMRGKVPDTDLEGVSLWEQWESAFMLGMKYAQDPMAVKSANDHMEALLAHLSK